MDIQQLTQRIEKLEALLSFVHSDRYIISKNLQLESGRNIQLGTSIGTKFGTTATQKAAFFGATPVVQAGAISAPSGGGVQDSQARTAISSLITAVKNFGITA